MAAPMKEKLIRLLDMGFNNYDTNIEALSMTRGDLEKAIILILAKNN
jgi:hypothetical protein